MKYKLKNPTGETITTGTKKEVLQHYKKCTIERVLKWIIHHNYLNYGKQSYTRTERQEEKEQRKLKEWRLKNEL